MDKKTILIVGGLGVVAYLLYKGKIIKKGSDTTPPPPDCPKCSLLRCTTDTVPKEVGECGCECVPAVIDSHPAPPLGCHYDSNWNLICDNTLNDGTNGSGSVPPMNYDYNPLLNLIQQVYVNSQFVWDDYIKGIVSAEIQKMSLKDLQTTQTYFTNAFNDVDSPKALDDAMDLVFLKFPLIGQPIITQNEINQSVIAAQRINPDVEVDNSFSDTMKTVSDVALTLGSIAVLVASAPVTAALAAIGGLALGISKLFRRKRK